MKVINVELSVKPGMQKDYEAFIDELVQGSRAEAGTCLTIISKKLAAIPITKLLNTGRMRMQLSPIIIPLTSKNSWLALTIS